MYDKDRQAAGFQKMIILRTLAATSPVIAPASKPVAPSAAGPPTSTSSPARAPVARWDCAASTPSTVKVDGQSAMSEDNTEWSKKVQMQSGSNRFSIEVTETQV